MEKIATSISVILMLVCQLAAQDYPNTSPNICIEIDGLPEQWIYLHSYHQNVISVLDSLYLDKDGTSCFRPEKSYPEGYYEIALPDSSGIPIILDRDQRVSLHTQLDQPLTAMQIKGGIENQLLYEQIRFNNDLNLDFLRVANSLTDELNRESRETHIVQLRSRLSGDKAKYIDSVCLSNSTTLFANMERAKQEPAILHQILGNTALDRQVKQSSMLDHYWDHVDFSDDRLLHTPVVFERLLDYMYSYGPLQTDVRLQAIDLLMAKVADNPSYFRFFATWLTEDYRPTSGPYVDAEAVYVHMVENYLTHEKAFWADSAQVYAWQVRALDRSNSLLGDHAANITAPDAEGVLQSLDQINRPFVLLYFYNPECEHCVATTPIIKELHTEYSEFLQVVGIAVSTEKDAWHKYIREQDLDWINMRDEDLLTLDSDYYFPGTPYTYLLDHNRIIIGKDLEPGDIPNVMKWSLQSDVQSLN